MSLHKPGRCVHFNGIVNHFCLAGVVYDQFRRKGFTLPCIHAESRAACELYQEPTEEQIAESEQLLETMRQRDAKLIPIIWALKTKYAKRSWSGTVDCPICGEQLNVSIAAINGHTRGTCTTEGCVSWIE